MWLLKIKERRTHMELNEKEKNKLLASLTSLHERGVRFNLTSTAIPNRLYDDVRDWVIEAISMLAPYNKGKQGLNLCILENDSLQNLNIGEAFTVLSPVVKRCVEHIRNGSFDSWFMHFTTKEMLDCVGFL